MSQIKETNQQGFAIVEAVLVVVIVGLIGVVGFYVLTQRKQADHNLTQTTPAAVTTVDPASTLGLQEVMQQDTVSENAVNSKFDEQDQSSVTSTNDVVSSLGGSYDESNL
ncbi:MAG: hypothetical protein NVSMB46_03130 [Candidatus Saccharimonadales bacterium]